MKKLLPIVLVLLGVFGVAAELKIHETRNVAIAGKDIPLPACWPLDCTSLGR